MDMNICNKKVGAKKCRKGIESWESFMIRMRKTESRWKVKMRSKRKIMKGGIRVVGFPN